MIQHLVTLLCRGVSIDQSTNLVSLFEIVDDFAVSAQPIQTPQQAAELEASPAIFELFSLWEREDFGEPERGQARIQFVGPDGQELSHQDFDVDLTNHQRLRLRAKMFGFPNAGAGRYWINALRLQGDQWERVGGFPVRIHFPPPTDQQLPGGDGQAN